MTNILFSRLGSGDQAADGDDGEVSGVSGFIVNKFPVCEAYPMQPYLLLLISCLPVIKYIDQ